jgi:hypothetical protein
MVVLGQMFVLAVATVILKALLAVPAGLEESVTLAVNGSVPAVVGVPLMTPLLLDMLSPGGCVPALIDQV